MVQTRSSIRMSLESAIKRMTGTQFSVQRRDLESQLLETGSSCRSKTCWWRLAIDLPLFIVVLIVVGLFEFGVIPQHKSGFFCNDPALSYPFTGDTVSMQLIVVSIILFPVLIIFPTEFIFIEKSHPFTTKLDQSFRKTLWLYRSYVYGLFFNFGLIEVMKAISGNPRPTFFDICEPDTAKTCKGSEYVSTFECTSTRFSKWFQSDSYHSFPSGHTSLSVYCGLFMAWYLQRRAFDWRHRTIFTVPLLQMLCLTYSAVSSLTRITDRRHHWWDVLTGAVIGVVCTLYAAVVMCNNFTPQSNKSAEEGMTQSQQSVRTLICDGRQSEPVA
ncbi:phospholipid phosphatase 1-like isoform X2 [Epargyreus clarus]|uniref:phospholipid phosphatase 1-like isoform X2 n=1 Tax=Epargyreus clarus TaxID=520877 RepID=UPI003C2E2C34